MHYLCRTLLKFLFKTHIFVKAADLNFPVSLAFCNGGWPAASKKWFNSALEKNEVKVGVAKMKT